MADRLWYVYEGEVHNKPQPEWSILITWQARDALQELTGGEAFNRQIASDYMDTHWRSNLLAEDWDDGGEIEIELSDKRWAEYREEFLNDVEHWAILRDKFNAKVEEYLD